MPLQRQDFSPATAGEQQQLIGGFRQAILKAFHSSQEPGQLFFRQVSFPMRFLFEFVQACCGRLLNQAPFDRQVEHPLDQPGIVIGGGAGSPLFLLGQER